MRSLFLLAAVVIAVPAANGQTAPAAFPRPGTLVRVTSVKSDTVVDYVAGQSLDSLWLSQRRFGRAEIASVATYQRNHGKGAVRGLKWGAGIGGAMILGGAIADATAGPCREFICIPAVAVGGFFAVLSTGIGTLIGAANAPLEWRPVR